MAKQEKNQRKFDESPSALLSEELLFGFYRNVSTLAVAVLGGIFSLRLALAPGALPLLGGQIGMGLIALSIVMSVSSQIDIVNKLKRKQTKSANQDGIMAIVVVFMFAMGTGMVGGSFQRELSQKPTEEIKEQSIQELKNEL